MAQTHGVGVSLYMTNLSEKQASKQTNKKLEAGGGCVWTH